MSDNEFPPNSRSAPANRPRKSSEVEPERTEVQQVTRTKGRRRKKPLHKRFIEAFQPEDNRGFVEYIIFDTLVPSIKDAVADASTAAIENALGVSSRGRSRRRRGSGESGYTSYNRMSGGSRREREEERRPARSGARVDVAEIIVDTRVEANEVIDQMIELISKYEVATMRDLLSLVGEPHTYTDEDWGWYDLRGARAYRISGGYLIDLPRPEHLD